MSIKKIVLITSGQPALNPRLVKEADALAATGYQVTVLYSYWNDWGEQLTQDLLTKKQWRAICVGGNPVNRPVVYFISRLLYKITKNTFSDAAISRSSRYLITAAKKHKADLYIGHNLGALPAVVKAAKMHNTKCGFDAEDFHRQEVSDDTSSYNYKIARYAEDKYYKSLNYFTTSSPQIAGVYKQLYPFLQPATILNVCPKNQSAQQRVPHLTRPVKLVWFSQTVGVNRGIDFIAKALKNLNDNSFELHLMGHIADDYKEQFIADELHGLKNVFFHQPIAPGDIIKFIAQFDIGLATESVPPFNRDICLTNKLFTYMQAGITIIASDTTAQKSIFETNPGIGKLYQKNELQQLIDILSAYDKDRNMLYQNGVSAQNVGRETLNWENESIKFLTVINATLAVN